MQIAKNINLFFNRIVLIAGKDFKSLVFTPGFFIFMGVSFVLLSYVFPRTLFRFISSYAMPSFGGAGAAGGAGGGNIHFDVFVEYISYLNIILFTTLPLLSAKILSAEKQNHSFDLLMTSPISSLQIVLGKYLALLMLLATFFTFSLLYPLSTSFWVDIPLGPLFSSYLGLFLLASVYAATGLLASATSSSFFLSAFMGWILNVGLLVVSHGQTFKSSVVNSIMDYLSLSQHLTNFIRGSLVLNSFVFFLCLVCFFLFLSFKLVEMERWKA